MPCILTKVQRNEQADLNSNSNISRHKATASSTLDDNPAHQPWKAFVQRVGAWVCAMCSQQVLAHASLCALRLTISHLLSAQRQFYWHSTMNSLPEWLEFNFGRVTAVAGLALTARDKDAYACASARGLSTLQANAHLYSVTSSLP